MGKTGLLTTAEVAERLGVSRRRVQALIHDKRLRAERLGRALLVREAEVARYAPLPMGRPAAKGKRKKTEAVK